MTTYNHDPQNFPNLENRSAEYSEETQKIEKTQADFGSDLLTIGSQGSPPKPEAEFRPDELLENAKILVSEGLIEDAKAILRKLLIQDRHSVSAHELMEEIQARELKVLLQERSESSVSEPFSKESLIEKLDRDLGLHLEDDTQDLLAIEILQSLFKKTEPSSWSLAEWLDLGVAFLTLEVYSAASLCFEEARRYHEDFTLVSLLALSYLKKKKAIEALSLLQASSCDPKLPLAHQLEVFYWMGRCYEQMKDQAAAQFYSQALKLDPHYRDTSRRYAALTADFKG